ncbi:MAG TPA: hypothetical protein DIT25_00680 [Candidatus Moranbacteria bacterium]|nr:hypothetical protein [Candidatus Moranbacteria bacterium]
MPAKISDLLLRIALWKMIIKELKNPDNSQSNLSEDDTQDDAQKNQKKIMKIIKMMNEGEALKVLSKYESDLKRYISDMNPERLSRVNEILLKETGRTIPPEYLPKDTETPNH